MQMLFLIYHEGLDLEVMNLLKEVGVEVYTRWETVTGKGRNSEPRLGTHVWPGFNSAMMIALEENKMRELQEKIKAVDQQHKGVGIKAFYWNLAEL